VLLLSSSLLQLFVKSNGDVFVMEVNIFKENFMIFSHSYSCTITLNYIRQVKLFNETTLLLSFIVFSLVVIEMWDQNIQSSSLPLLFLLSF